MLQKSMSNNHIYLRDISVYQALSYSAIKAAYQYSFLQLLISQISILCLPYHFVLSETFHFQIIL